MNRWARLASLSRVTTWIILSAAVLATTGLFPGRVFGQETPLDQYVRKADASYGWKLIKTIPGDGVRTFIIHLKSQTWRSKAEVDRTLWEHWLVIVKPDKVTSKTAFLLVGGGSNDSAMPESANPMTLVIAKATGTVVAELRMVPNQPLVFNGDGKKRKEDDLIAYTWDQFLKTGDITWSARFPMVKSVVRAMDCLQEFLRSKEGGGVIIEKFVVAGGSKRGWTTWLAGAVDGRVEAIIPIVIDVVNVEPSMRHHAHVYGFWAKAIGDYFRHGIMQRWNEPRLRQLYQVEDPYFYRDRLKKPMFIVNATGDQFFCPDSSQFYFEDLKGEKHLRYVPNADHSLRGSDSLDSIIGFYEMILTGKPRPRFSWTFEKEGAIRVKAQDRPKQVTLWQAHNPKSRDFRLLTIGKAFTSQPLTAREDGSFVAKVEPGKEGWTAFFVELTYDTGGTCPIKLTTAVRILPDRLPFANLDPAKVPSEP